MKTREWTGPEIKSLRLSLNLSQGAFAARLGLANQQKISLWEKEINRPSRPAIQLLEALYQRAYGDKGVG